MEVESKYELDRPRPIPIHDSRDNTYLAASGNLVCHPVEHQVSNTHTVRTEVQPSNVNVNVSDNRIASGGAEEQITHVSTGIQVEMSNCIPPRQPLGNLLDLLNGHRLITGIHGLWHRNSFEGTNDNIKLVSELVIVV
jgi:hypothetical protein